MAGLLERENPFVADQSEQSGLLELQRRFDAPLKPQLVSPDGPPIELPETLYEILTVVVRELLAGHAVSILPSDLELTTTQAAEILHVSRDGVSGRAAEPCVASPPPSRRQCTATACPPELVERLGLPSLPTSGETPRHL